MRVLWMAILILPPTAPAPSCLLAVPLILAGADVGGLPSEQIFSVCVHREISDMLYITIGKALWRETMGIHHCLYLTWQMQPSFWGQVEPVSLDAHYFGKVSNVQLVCSFVAAPTPSGSPDNIPKRTFYICRPSVGFGSEATFPLMKSQPIHQEPSLLFSCPQSYLVL